MAEVACRSLSKRFGPITALDGVSLHAPGGGVTLVLGPSGAGKTTLLRVIAGLERPDAGEVSIGGRPMTAPGRFTPPHRRGVAMVFQRPTLWPHLSAVENVALALCGSGLRRRERRARARAVLERLGMARCYGACPAALSGGERQRVGLARALVVEPAVLLLDEPFASLDVDLRRDLTETLRRLRAERGATVVWVTHRSEEALALADRVVLLRAGRVAEAGPAEEVFSRPRTAFGARFLAGANLLRGRITRPGRASTALGEIPAEGARVGEEVLLALPPEAFALDAEGPIRGRVAEVEFRGRYFACSVLAGGERLVVHLRKRVEAGSEVRLQPTAPAVAVEE